jgi:hypothetical protein
VTKHFENSSLVLGALPRARPQLVRELIQDAGAAKAPKCLGEPRPAERDGASA